MPATFNLAAHDNSPAHYAKGTPSGPKTLRPLVSTWFQVLFHSPPGVLFTFPSRYWFTIGRRRVFSLRRWSSQIHTGFLVSRATRVPDPGSRVVFAYGTITFYGCPFQAHSANHTVFYFPTDPSIGPTRPHNPDYTTLTGLTCNRFRLFPFRSPLLRESRLLSLPRGT